MRKRCELLCLKTLDDFNYAYVAQNQIKKKHPVDKVVTNFEGGVPFLRHRKQNIDTRFLDADA